MFRNAWDRAKLAAVGVFFWPTHLIRAAKISYWTWASYRRYPNSGRARGFYLAPRLLSIWGGHFLVVHALQGLQEAETGSAERDMYIGGLKYLELHGVVTFQGGRPW